MVKLINLCPVGEMLTKEQILDLVAPSTEDHDAVVNWFKSQGTHPYTTHLNIVYCTNCNPTFPVTFPGLVEVRSFGDALKVTAPVHTIENMLQTTLYTFVHRDRPLKAIRQVGGFKIPASVSDKIYMITGLTSFPFVPKQAKMTDAPKKYASSGFHLFSIDANL
jgi:hypothetical protein